MSETLQLDLRAGIGAARPLGVPLDAEISALGRTQRGIRRWWKQQNTRYIEDEAVSAEALEDRLELLRSSVAATQIRLQGEANDIALTTSIGSACMPQDGSRVEELLARADERLYEAKRAGRNRIVATPRVGAEPQS